MNFRIDEIFEFVFDRLGIFGVIAGFAILAYAVAARYLRALGLVILLLILSQSWFGPAVILSRSLRWWVLMIVCVRGLTLLAPTGVPTTRSPARLTAALLGLLALASSAWSGNHEFSIGVALTFVVSLAAAFVVLWRLMDTEDVLAAACKGALWVSVLIFGTGFVWVGVAYASSDWHVVNRAGWGGRYSGIFFNANMSGVLAMMVLPALVAAPASWLGRGRWLRWPAILMAASAIYLSGSRSALVGAVLAILILYLHLYGAGALLTVAMAAVGMYVVATSSHIEDIDASAVGHITRTQHLSTLSGRVGLWEEGLEAVDGHWLTGLGWGSSRMLHGADAEESLETGGVMRDASNLHSTHVQILVDLGVPGLLLLWALCAQTLWAGWLVLLQPAGERTLVHVMVLASFVSTLADTFVHGSVLSTGNPSALIFWSSSAILCKEAARIRLSAYAGEAPARPAPPGPDGAPAGPVLPAPR